MRSKSRNAAPSEEPKLPFGAIAFPQAGGPKRSKTPMRLLLYSLPLVLVVVLFGLWLTSLFLWTMSARSQVDEGRIASAQVQYERQIRFTGLLPEPWLAHYNLGTAMLADGDLVGGIENLELAFDGVPKAKRNDVGSIQPFSYECMVRMNLGAGIEMQGDLKAEVDATEEANEYYAQALELVTVCEVPSSSSSDTSEGGNQGGGSEEDQGEGGFGESPEEQNEAAAQPFEQDGNEAGDRLREKLSGGQGESEEAKDGSGAREDAKEDDSNDQGDQGQTGSDLYGNETPEERERRERLEDRNREQAERQREREEYGHRNPGTGGW